MKDLDTYPSEKFGQAVDTLLVANELLGGRIHDAFEFHLYKIRPDEHPLPEEVASRLRQIQADIQRFGIVSAWVESLDDVAKTQIARWVLESYEAIEQESAATS